MKIAIEIDSFAKLLNNSWSGALDTLNGIPDDKEEDLLQLVEDVFCDTVPTETEVNDFLWFDRDYIYEQLNIGDF